MNQGDRVTFASFEGGSITPLEGTFVSMDADFVTVDRDGTHYKFRRAPGSKSGWGVGASGKWRLGLEERKAMCIADAPRGRR